MSESLASAPRLFGGRIAITPRLAITAIFLVQGMLFASWTAHIPQVKRALGLDDATLGSALLGAPVGSIVAMIVAGWMLPRIGSKRIVQVSLVGYLLAGVGVGLADSFAQLFAALLVWGIFLGALDVSMNTQGVTIERSLRRPIMSGLHGAWSIGAFSGAALGALAVAAGLSLAVQIAIVGVILLAITGWFSSQLLPEPAHELSHEHHHGGSLAVLKSPAVLILGGIAFAGMLCEGAVADWSAVYLHESLGASGGVAGLGYAAYSLTMVTLRLSGNLLFQQRSPRVVLPTLAAIATIGFLPGLLVGNVAIAMIGFAALGVGLATIVPTTFSAAGALSGHHAGTAIAAVSALGWAGFVIGPPLIGHLADATSLPFALGLIPVLTAIIVMATRVTPVLDEVPSHGH